LKNEKLTIAKKFFGKLIFIKKKSKNAFDSEESLDIKGSSHR